MKTTQRTAGWYHVMAAVTVMIWGTTFVATKVLIKYGLSPVDILFYRFLLAYICIWFFSPRVLLAKSWQDELRFVGLGLCGGSLYFVAENTALGMTLASNVSLIICTTPILTALLAPFFYKGDKLKARLIGGSLMALIGVGLVVFNGSFISQDINYYFTNGTYYMDMGAQGKYKMAMSFDDVLNGMEISAMNSSVPVSAIESITKGSGGMTVKYNMNSVFSSDLFDELLGGMLDGVSIKTRDMNVTAKAVNGMLTDTAISGTVDITAEGETISATLNAAAKVTATGDAVKITLPTDLSSYVDLPTEIN